MIETLPPVLVSLLEKEAVPLMTLRARYGALLGLVDALLGVVPNCDSYLEIWPLAFRTYNVMVPNFHAAGTHSCTTPPSRSRRRTRASPHFLRRRRRRTCRAG